MRGYCAGAKHRLLVYNYMEHGSSRNYLPMCLTVKRGLTLLWELLEALLIYMNSVWGGFYIVVSNLKIYT